VHRLVRTCACLSLAVRATKNNGNETKSTNGVSHTRRCTIRAHNMHSRLPACVCVCRLFSSSRQLFARAQQRRDKLVRGDYNKFASQSFEYLPTRSRSYQQPASSSASESAAAHAHGQAQQAQQGLGQQQTVQTKGQGQATTAPSALPDTSVGGSSGSGSSSTCGSDTSTSHVKVEWFWDVPRGPIVQDPSEPTGWRQDMVV
jgi:hypothetical protein